MDSSPRCREDFYREFSPNLARYSAKKNIVVERICSPWIRLCFGSLPSASFVKVERRCWTTSNIRSKLRVQTERLYEAVARRVFAQLR
jgi:hypothetical protein